MITHAEFKARWAKLSEPQRNLVRAKANWEHMSPWAVMGEYWPDKDPEPLDACRGDAAPQRHAKGDGGEAEG